MGRRGQRKPRIPPREAADPEGLGSWMLRYLERLRIRNYSELTVRMREHYLAGFLAWCQTRELTRPAEVTRPLLLRYQRHLFHYRKKSGAPLAFQSQRLYLVGVRDFFKWLVRENVLLYNPAGELEMPKLEERLPRYVLTAAEAEAVMALPNVHDALGVRDRAILETFYSTGMRRMELVGLQVFDLDVARGTVMIRQGKGKKDRMVPIGERALAWTEKYQREVRPRLVREPDAGTLFLTRQGKPFVLDVVTQIVGRYVGRANLGKQGSCHLWRHTCATLMLEGGADLRCIQELLGHEKLTTTQVYTQVSIRRLQEIHRSTHPSAKLERSPRPEGPADPADPTEAPGLSLSPSGAEGPSEGRDRQSEHGSRPSGESEAARAGPDLIANPDPLVLPRPVEAVGECPPKALRGKKKRSSLSPS